jgi:formylglycine-generating enzyme required for sulfatase activity
MKKMSVLLALSATCSLLFSTFNAANAASVDQVIVRQQWPWSTDIKVEYRLSGTAGPVDIAVACFNGSTPLTVLDQKYAISGDVHGVTDSAGTIVIDPKKAFGPGRIAFSDFRVELTASDSPTNVSDVIYRIFDLDDGSCTDVTRADLLNNRYGTYETSFAAIDPEFSTGLSDVIIWTGVTNNPVYKTSKLVMRKINARGREWYTGSAAGEYTRHADSERRYLVELTNDYFISVFKLTQAQGEKIYGSNPSLANMFSDSPHRPFETITYSDVRGHYLDDSTGDGEKINWPTNTQLHAVRDTSLLGKLRTKTGYEFEIPTEMQWEFACRAGTAGTMYTGDTLYSSSMTGQMATVAGKISWPAADMMQVTNEATGAEAYVPQVVGRRAPNAFGLYDMLGNGVVWCLDCHNNDVNYFDADHPSFYGTAKLYEPQGARFLNSNSLRVMRGQFPGFGGSGDDWSFVRSAKRMRSYVTRKDMMYCIRLTCPVGTTW